MINRILLAGGVIFALGGLAAPVLAKEMTAAEFLAAVATNGDHTLSKDEVEAYARKRIAEIESDKDKTLDATELKGRLNATNLALADTDKDKTVDEAEFVSYADRLFEDANRKGKNSLSADELKTPAGQKLIDALAGK